MCARAWEESVTCQVCCRESFHCGPARTCLPTLWKCQDPASWQLVPRALCYLSSLKAPGFNFELFLCQGPAGPLEMKTDPCSRGAPPPVWGVWHTTRSPPQTRQSGRVQRAGLQGENAVWWWNQVLQMEEGTGLHFALTDERILTGGGGGHTREASPEGTGTSVKPGGWVQGSTGRRPQSQVETKAGEDSNSSSGGCLQSLLVNSWTGRTPAVGLNGMRPTRRSTRGSGTETAAFIRGSSFEVCKG